MADDRSSLHNTNDLVPIPDPTRLTTAQLDREIEHLKTLLFARFDAVEAERVIMRAEMERYRDAAKELIEIKIDKVDDASTARYLDLETTAREQVTRIDQLLAEMDKRVAGQIAAQAHVMDLSLAAAKEAVAKADVAYEKRFDNVDEFRKQLSEQAHSFLPRREYEAVHQQLLDRVNGMSRVLDVVVGQKEGHSQVWGFIVGAGGIIIAAVTLVVTIVRHL
jgi:hypothetical protein